MYKLIPAFLLLFGTAAFATTVYKTVDENGVVSFSDKPPADNSQAEVMQVSAPAPQAPEEYIARLEAMRETTDRMASDRMEREKHRAEMKEIQARTASYQQPEQSDYSSYTDYYPVHAQSYRRRGHVPYRPIHRPKPVHPIARAPMRAGNGGSGSSNAQLMRPLVSSRR